MEKLEPDTSDKRRAYIIGLTKKIQLGDEEGQEALEELYGCANGGDPLAQEYVRLQEQILQAIEDAAV